MPVATLDDAIALACQQFHGVVDKAGEPYILHCLLVMLAQSSNHARQVAVLHDVVEDTAVTIDQIRARGFATEVVDAIELLTHRPPDTYADYVVRLSANPIATAVKLADLKDNYRLDRVAYRQDHRAEDVQRIQKYILSYQYLTRQIGQSDYLARMQALHSL